MKVTDFSFADYYRVANLQPGPDIIRLRQEAFESLRSEIDIKRAVELTRLYFGLVTKETLEWFVEAFNENDPSFSLIDNQREAAVLADCLLSARIEDGLVGAGLAVLSASVNGNRSPIVDRSNLGSIARDKLHSFSLTDRKSDAVDLKTIDVLVKSKVSNSIDECIQAPDLNKVATLIKQVSEEGIGTTTHLTKQANRVLQEMSERIDQLEEESSMLWWYVGGWSRILECPFSDLKLPLAAGMAGIDLAMLTKKAPGPIAVPAIFYRLLTAGRKGKMPKVSIQDMVDDFPVKHYDQLNLSSTLKNVLDLCPILTGFYLASEIGDSVAWKPAFLKQVGIDANTEFEPMELAMQVYRESLLLSLLND